MSAGRQPTQRSATVDPSPAAARGAAPVEPLPAPLRHLLQDAAQAGVLKFPRRKFTQPGGPSVNQDTRAGNVHRWALFQYVSPVVATS